MSNDENTAHADSKCPECRADTEHEEIDVGVGTVCGPRSCYNCGWVESERFKIPDIDFGRLDLIANNDSSNKPIKQIYDGYMNDSSPVPRTTTEFGQPAPTPNDKPALWPMVIEDVKNLYPNEPEVYASIEIRADMAARDQFGRKKYGVPLQPNNGRDPLKDAYEELLDAAVYLKQTIVEKSERKPTVGSRSYSDLIALEKLYKSTLAMIFEIYCIQEGVT